MTNEVYSLQDLRRALKLWKAAMDIIFPGDQATIKIFEGGWTNDRPWRVTLEPKNGAEMKFKGGGILVDFVIQPQQALDHLSHGGMSRQEWSANLIWKTLEHLARGANDPQRWFSEANKALNTHLSNLMAEVDNPLTLEVEGVEDAGSSTPE